MRSGCERTATALAVVSSGLLLCNAALAEGSVEPTYGRIAGDACLVVGAGAVVAPRGARAEGDLRLRYLDTAGLFASYEDALFESAGSEPHRVISGGLELRPVFLYRWLRGLETRRDYFDLAIDSLGLELGAVLAAPSEAPSDLRPGVQVGLGLEIPLRPAATGLWMAVHGGVRWDDRSLALGSVQDARDRAAYLTMTLSWHQVLSTHIVSVSDQLPP
jgi:hypothetical protein